MPFSRFAENRIREAMEQGEFDNLPGAGRPLDLEEYFSAPDHLRMAYSILKSAHCVPAEVGLLNEIAGLERTLAQVTDPDARTPIEQRIRDRRLQLAVMLETRPRRDR